MVPIDPFDSSPVACFVPLLDGSYLFSAPELIGRPGAVNGCSRRVVSDVLLRSIQEVAGGRGWIRIGCVKARCFAIQDAVFTASSLLDQ
jgi:hypothetical protein